MVKEEVKRREDEEDADAQLNSTGGRSVGYCTIVFCWLSLSRPIHCVKTTIPKTSFYNEYEDEELKLPSPPPPPFL